LIQSPIGQDGDAALMAAARYGHAGLVKNLVESKAQVNFQNDQGATPLIASSIRGHTDIVKTLVENKADVNHTTKNGDSALSLATWKNQTKTALVLLEAGADVQKTDRYGDTVLHDAAKHGDPVLMKKLIEMGAVVDKKNTAGRTALVNCMNAKHFEGTKLLLESRAIVTAAVSKIAKSSGSEALIKLCEEFKGGVIPSMKDDVFLDHIRNKKPISDLVFNETKDRCLMLAARSGRMDMVKDIVAHYPEEINQRNGKNSTALIAAAMRGHTDIVVCLLEAKAAVNVTTKKGDTALSLAIWKNHSETAIVLLDAKADPTNVDSYGDSVLHDLSRNDNIRVMLEVQDCLKDPNFEPSCKDSSEKKTEHQENKTKEVKGGPETLQRMVDVRNKKDISPLSCAISSKKINMVRLLLDMKAEVTDTELHQSYANPEMKTIVEKALEERKLPLFKDDTEDAFLATLSASSISNPRSGPNNAPPAVWAAERGNVRVLTAILKAHLKSLLDEDERGWDPMLAAANSGRASALMVICEAWARNDRQIQKQLSRQKVVEKYLKALGASIAQQQTAAALVLLSDSFLEALDISGEILDAAPLVALAVTTKNLTVLKELTEVGAGVASKDSEGETALHMALKQEKPSIKMIRVLLDNGAKIDKEALAIRGLD